MKTYQFNYEPADINGFTETQFCAESLKEAKELFADFCKNDLKDFHPEHTEISVVYNKDDHDEYGDDYEF